MEGQMRKSAAMGDQQRLDEGFAFARSDMRQSIDVLLQKTKLGSIPKSEAAVGTLRGIQRIAELGEGPLGTGELLAIARQYEAARDELKVVSGRRALRPNPPPLGPAVLLASVLTYCVCSLEGV